MGCNSCSSSSACWFTFEEVDLMEVYVSYIDLSNRRTTTSAENFLFPSANIPFPPLRLCPKRTATFAALSLFFNIHHLHFTCAACLSVLQHVKWPEKIWPRDSRACCWDVKQPTQEAANQPHASVPSGWPCGPAVLLERGRQRVRSSVKAVLN